MKKITLLIITLLVFMGCSTKFSNFKKSFYEPIGEAAMLETGRIAVVGAFPDRYTKVFIDEMEAQIVNKTDLELVDQKAITAQFPDYPCNVISYEDDSRRAEGSGFSRTDILQAQIIGDKLDLDYVLLSYVIFSGSKTVTYTVHNSNGSSSTTSVDVYQMHSKGILWDVKAQKEIAQYDYLPHGQLKNKFLELKYYSNREDLKYKIAENAADDILLRIRREHL